MNDPVMAVTVRSAGREVTTGEWISLTQWSSAWTERTSGRTRRERLRTTMRWSLVKTTEMRSREMDTNSH